MKQIPNLFTLLNLLFGCLAIVFLLQNGIEIIADAQGGQLLVLPEKIWMASLFIGLAGVVDFLDGFVARLFKATSAMGKQLDSLADVVSFGVAPGMIIYQFLRLSIAQQEDGLSASIIWLVPAFIVPCAAAWRLAKFNIDTEQEYGFKGVPTPAVGLLIASLPLIYWNVEENWVREILLNQWFLYAFIAIVSFLMVSNIPILSFKFKDFSVKNNLPKYILVLIAVVAVIILKWLAVPVIFITYVLVSLLFKNKTT
ncbi:MAG TPA: CDP-alcohol phosphatidyltransferase family protein [Chitinophagaceae bacterium]